MNSNIFRQNEMFYRSNSWSDKFYACDAQSTIFSFHLSVLSEYMSQHGRVEYTVAYTASSVRTCTWARL